MSSINDLPLIYCFLLFVMLTLALSGAEARGSKRKAQHCTLGTHTCHIDAVCIATKKTYRCKCKPGYEGDGKVCIDTDECAKDNGGCAHMCVNTPGNYTCACKPGFQLAEDGSDCVDINECFNRKGGCSHQCVNTLGSFECQCNSGYSLDKVGKNCVYGEWCKIKFGCDHGCKPSSVGNYVDCFCREGYFLHTDGKTCVRSCQHGNGGCQHICNNTVTGPVCSCAPNYILNEDKRTCTASCAVNNGGCERKCSDSSEGPVCSCPAGYKLHLDGRSCLDVDECALKTDGCSHKCENTRGSFECVCPEGYKVSMDYKTCVDIDECRLNTTCDHQCTNTPGSFQCNCNPGYQTFGITHCGDINECSVHNGGCAHSCSNSEGSYTCSCGPGFKLHPNKHDCIEANQCTPLIQQDNAKLTCTKVWPNDQRCQLECPNRLVGSNGLLNTSTWTVTCGASTGYNWTNLVNDTLPSCAGTFKAPSIARRAKFLFIYDSCAIDSRDIETMRQNLTMIVNTEKKYRCLKKCQVNSLDLMCGSKRKKFRKLVRRKNKVLITAEFDLVLNPKKVKANGKCDVECTAKRTARRFNRIFKKLRRAVRRNKLALKLGSEEVRAVKKSLKYDRKHYRELCIEGMELRGGVCIGCRVGSFYSRDTERCELCPRGTYQDEEARLSCKMCPNSTPGSGIIGATSPNQCSELCEPGTVSPSGKKPCQVCPKGTYQPYFGRTSCMTCGQGLATASVGSDGFEDCLAKVTCDAGHFYNRTTSTCMQCPKGFYQPRTGQDFCFTCPGLTSTDFPSSTSEADCKDRQCGNYMGEFFGVLKSPNYPGPYPVDIDCVWKIRPEKRRRILIIIPDIALSDEDKCGDILSMRKSKSVYSQSTYETCESRHKPIAFTARSKKLWIQFKSDGNNTAGGFSIPFVTYNEEYEALIEDIVRDGRLYSSKQHQQIFKDRELLTALLEVIATPYSYLKYANISHTMFPQSFFRLLVPKVRRFFET